MTNNTASSASDTPTTVDAVLSLRLGALELQVAVTTTEHAVQGIEFNTLPGSHWPERAPRTALAEQAARQLERYADDPRWSFSLPLELHGTPHQQRLWQALRQIPAGNWKTYGQLARQLNSAAQAVGQACRRNPVPIIVPCHRVLAASGLGGYAGAVAGEKLDIKRALLMHEGWVG